VNVGEVSLQRLAIAFGVFFGTLVLWPIFLAVSSSSAPSIWLTISAPYASFVIALMILFAPSRRKGQKQAEHSGNRTLK
jgi:hypothetical protein